MNMTIFNVLSLIGGLALFLFGMNVMGQALEKAAGNSLKGMLERMSGSPLRGLLMGMGVTAVIQSSSATTVMVVGFVNSGLMQLRQAIGIIMGANIGTTVTAWILSLTGVDGDSLFIKLLKPSSFTPVLALIGIVLIMKPKKSTRSADLGTVLLGFAVLMNGMDTMSAAVKPLASSEGFTSLFLMFENPILGVLAGAVLTAIIQSSSASVGILQALSATGAVSFAAAVPIIMGQNIGTCATAMLSSVGTNKNARRAALVHLYFNLIGTAVCLVLFLGARAFLHIALLEQAVDAFSISVIHTIFNVSCTVILFPMQGLLEKLALRSVRDSDEDKPLVMLDERLMQTPAVAVERSRVALCEMADAVLNNMLLCFTQLVEPDHKVYEQICEAEETIDRYEDELGSYLVELSALPLTDEDSRLVSYALHAITDIERIGDHAVNLAERSQDMKAANLAFSDVAKAHLTVITDALNEIVTLTNNALHSWDEELFARVEPLEQVIDGLTEQMKDFHIARLRTGECTLETGVAFNDLLTDVERMSDHCSNLAGYALADIQHHRNKHAFLDSVKTKSNFATLFEEYQQKYFLNV